jgi:hypothetical protein
VIFMQFLIWFASAGVLDTLIETIRTFAIVLIVIGMLAAFMRKIAWLIEFMAGLALTCIITYIIWNWSQNIALTILMFFFFLVGTIVSATVAEIIVIVEGFIATWIGVGIILITEGWGINMNTAIVSAIISAVLIWISATLGGNITKIFPEIHRRKTKREPEGKSVQEIKTQLDKPSFSFDRQQIGGYPSFDIIEHAKRELEEIQTRMEIGEISLEEFENRKQSIKQRLLNERDKLLDLLSKIEEVKPKKMETTIKKAKDIVSPIVLIQCPHCNAKIPKGSLYCPECGGKQEIAE